MRLDIALVGKDGKTIIAALKQMIDEDDLNESDCTLDVYLPEETVEVDYTYTDSNDVFGEDPDAHVLDPMD